VGGTLSVNDNRNVVGQTDGASITFGYKVDAGVAFLRGKHEWRDALFLAQSLSKTPTIPHVLKSQDALRFESIYLYHVVPWFGPYLRLAGDGPILAGFDERPVATNYLIRNVDGTTTAKTTTQLHLTDMFRPYNLTESLGPFLRPLHREEINVEIRVGASAHQTFANHQLAINDDAATKDVVEVDELQTYHQIGVEAAAIAWGKLSGDKVLYKAGVEAMMPLYKSDTLSAEGKSSAELINVIGFGTLSFKIVSWASIDYDFRVVRQPQLIDKTQVQNHLLLTFGINVGSKPKAKE